MWLTYGVDAHQALVAIDDVPRGKSSLRCPYCGGPLTAKKGRITQHHFAHTEDTCRAVARESDLPTLPLYDQFHLHLSGRELEDLHRYWQAYGAHGWSVPVHDDSPLVRRALLAWNRWRDRQRGGYAFTKLGQIPVGALSLRLFTEVQEPLIMQRLAHLEAMTTNAWQRQLPTWEQDLTDLRLYRAQLRRILAVSLYFCEVRAEQAVYYKIGVTSRPLNEWVEEIRQDLLTQRAAVTVTVLDARPHRGNVELYFKHRYHAHQQRIGTLTEYFQFEDVTPVLRDLRRMPSKELSVVEREILDGLPSALERHIAETTARQAAQEAAWHAAEQRSMAIKQGMQRVAAQGVHVGRPTGSTECPSAFLAKPATQLVIAALDRGASLRKAAQSAGVSVNTVRKVVALVKTTAPGHIST